VVKKIITHSRPGHTDDILAVALLTQKYPEAEVEFVHPQSPELERYKEDYSVILVDIGGDYSPVKKNYDHHQNIDLPCSLVLVLKHEFPEYYRLIEKNPLYAESLAYLDYKDRFGPKRVEEVTGVNPVGSFLLEELVVKSLGETPEGLRALGKAMVERLERELQLRKALDAVEKREIDGLKVILDPVGIPLQVMTQEFGKDAFDLVIQRNTRNPEHTSITKNTFSPRADEIDLEPLRKEAVFFHQAGFMCVLPEPFEKVAERAEEIVEQILDEGESPSP